MGGPVQPIHPLNGDGRSALTLDLRTHFAQTARQIDDLWFTGCVVQHRCALGQSRRHQRVFRGPDGHEGEIHHSPAQPPTGGLGMNIAITQIQISAHRFKGLQVQIDRTRSNGASAGQRHHRMAITRQHWAQNKDRGAHFAHNVIIGRVIGDIVR